MNFINVLNQLGLLIAALAAVLLLMAGFAALADQDATYAAAFALLISAGIGGTIGGALVFSTRKRSKYIGRREALLLVALSWFVGAGLAALPFLLWAHADESQINSPFRHFVDCYFEAMSGFTTTGATVLSDISQLPPSLLLWRALTHWFGGLGIVVLFVAVLPSLGVGGKKLFRVEATGPAEGIQPTIRDTARVLWYIYVGFTAISSFALWVAGMNLFEAICHAMSMVSTGGFSTRNGSIGEFNSTAISVIVIVGMLLAGVNFGLFYALTQRRWRIVWKDVELRFYLVLKIGVALFIAMNLGQRTITLTTGEQLEPTGGVVLREAAFTTVALHTGTGFCTSDYSNWPDLTLSLLIGLMIIGGCAGSTAGGVKVIRVWISLKVLAAEIEKAFRPNVVRPIRVNKQIIDERTAMSAVAYVAGMVLLCLLGAVLIRIFEPGEAADLKTIFTASLSTIANVGPGMGNVGAIHNYGWFTPAAKVVMIVLMALGRLELFAIVVLFSPRFWRGN